MAFKYYLVLTGMMLSSIKTILTLHVTHVPFSELKCVNFWT